jgi:hypothetical protein
MGNVFGLPVGVSFVGTTFSEPKLITLASGFEAASKARIVPQFLPTLPADAPHGHRVTGRTATLPRARPHAFRI